MLDKLFARNENVFENIQFYYKGSGSSYVIFHRFIVIFYFNIRKTGLTYILIFASAFKHV